MYVCITLLSLQEASCRYEVYSTVYCTRKQYVIMIITNGFKYHIFVMIMT
jgi:hypothetical protein